VYLRQASYWVLPHLAFPLINILAEGLITLFYLAPTLALVQARPGILTSAALLCYSTQTQMRQQEGWRLPRAFNGLPPPCCGRGCAPHATLTLPSAPLFAPQQAITARSPPPHAHTQVLLWAQRRKAIVVMWRFRTILLAIAVARTVFVLPLALLALGLAVAAKWALVGGRRRPGRYDWDTSAYNQRWQVRCARAAGVCCAHVAGVLRTWVGYFSEGVCAEV